MDIGERIRALREQKKITQSELAEAVGVQSTAVTLWESKKNPRGITGSHLQKVAEALGVSVSDLLGESERLTSTVRPKMASMAVTFAEQKLLELFRSFPQELQLLQLAQFIDCAKFRKVEHFSSHEASNPLTVSGAGRDG